MEQTRVLQHMPRNLWRTWGRMNFPIDSLVLYLPLWEPSQASLLNGTGIATEAPLALVGPAAQTLNVTQAGTFLVYLPTGATGTATSGTATLTGSPVSLVGGLNTITAQGTGTFTVTLPVLISKDLNAHVATITGATKGLQGRTFDGLDDNINCTNSALLAPALLTLEAWVESDRLTAGTVIGRNGGAGVNYGYWLVLGDTSGKITFGVGNSSGTPVELVSSSSYLINTWYHLAGVYNGTQTILYINGVSDGTPQTVDSLNQVTQITHVGKYRTSDSTIPFKGTIGDVWIYNRALSVAEIQHNYLATRWRYV